MAQQLLQLLFVFILFIILTPGVVLTLPPPPVTSRVLVAFVHSIVFTILFYLGTKYILNKKQVKY
jgi:NADH:ubiquinone oxidoreductase subunit 3 (subunit A)